MFAVRARRTLALGLTGAAAAVSLSTANVVHADDGARDEAAPRPKRDKLPIYSAPAPELVLVETHTELERHIGDARRALEEATLDTRDRVQGVVSRWIGVEKAVERKVTEILPKDEPLTPGILYAGVATLAGSIVARNRSFPIRVLAPPTFFFISLNYFLPKASHNLSAYYEELESAYAPSLTSQRHALLRSTRQAFDGAIEKVRGARNTAEGWMDEGARKVEGATGLKVHEVMAKAERGLADEVEALKKDVEERIKQERVKVESAKVDADAEKRL